MVIRQSITISLLGLMAAAAASARPLAGTAIVTGGGRGIGAACSRALAARGYGVVISYVSDAESAAAVSTEIQDAGGMAATFRADVGCEADVVNLFAFADTAFGEDVPLTALVNNAGVLGSKDQSLASTTSQELHELIAVNVAGPLTACREAEKRMSTANGGKGGAIVQISSGSAYIGSPLLYASSKGALNSLTIGLVKPLAQVGIRINTVSPGMTETDLVAEVIPRFDFTQIPLGRIGQPSEVANAVVWLLSEEASYVAGANMRVAGGRPPGTTLG